MQLLEKIQFDKKLVILSPDIGNSLNSKIFEERYGIFSQDKYQSRFIKMPLAENLTFSVAEGMIFEGMTPIIGIYDGLLSIVIEELSSLARSMDLDKNCVIIITTHAGFSSPDGRGIQSVCSPALVMCLPNIKLFEPIDEVDSCEILEEILKIQKGIYIIRCTNYYSKRIRSCREVKKIPGFYVITKKPDSIDTFKREITIITNTPFIDLIIDIQDELKAICNIKIIAITCINKVIDDTQNIVNEIQTSDMIILLSDVIKPFLRSHVEHILYKIKEKITIPIVLAPEKYGECGKFSDLLSKYGLNKDSIKKIIIDKGEQH
jgi:transketolase C-terminal domain/subunit